MIAPARGPRAGAVPGRRLRRSEPRLLSTRAAAGADNAALGA
ncbi:hypothetical protein [Brachybacterium sacelli]